MSESMLAYLRLMEPSLDPRLVSASAVEDMRQVARLFPVVKGFDMECRVGVTAPRADFLMRVLPTDPCYAALLESGAESPLPEALRAHPIWRRLGDFCRTWSQKNSSLEGLGDIFLEFDVAEGPRRDVPVPCCFLDFARSPGVEQLEQALAMLMEEAFSPDVRACLRRCFAALPERGRIPSVGIMFPRDMQGFRYCAGGARTAGWLDYLERVEWPGSRSSLERALSDFTEQADRVELDLDVGASVGPKVGFELQMDPGRGDRGPRWERLLQRFVDLGHCLPEKRDAVLSWIGHVHERARLDIWPENLRRMSREIGGTAASVFTRRIGHMKVVYLPDRPLELKVYLECMQYWFRHSKAQGKYVMDQRDPEAWKDES